MSRLKTFFFSLALRISLVLVMTLVVLFAFVNISVKFNEQAERRIYTDFVENKAALLNHEIATTSETLSTFVHDYTFWDDMVDFAAAPSDEKADLVLAGSLDTYNADLLWVFNSDAQLTYSQSVDSETIPEPEVLAPVTGEQLPNVINPENLFASYYVRNPLGIMEVHAASIHPTDDESRSTPASGYFMVGKFIDDDYLEGAAEVFSGEIKLLDDPGQLTMQQIEFDHHSGRYGFVVPFNGLDEQAIGGIYASGYSDSIHQVLTFRDRMITYGVLVMVTVILICYGAAYNWVLRPLFKIQSALRSKDDSHIESLKKNHDEFSSVARLMSDSMKLLGNYEAIITSIKDGLVVIDAEGRTERINQTASDVLGYQESELVGLKFVDIVPAYDYHGNRIPDENRPIVTAIKTKQATSSNHMFMTKNGRKIDVRINVSPIISGDQLQGAIAIFNDNSKEMATRRAIEQEVAHKTAELRRVRAQLEASINSLHVGFLMTDKNGRLVILNPSAKKLLSGQVGNQADWDIESVYQALGPEAKFSHALKQSLSTGKPVEIKEYELHDKVLSIYLAPVLTDNGNQQAVAVGCVVLIEDVTEVVVATRSRDEFFSIASHELRTPLTSIKGNSSMILDFFGNELKSPDLKEMVTDIHESSSRLISIVNDFLDVSRIEQGKLKFEITSLDLADLINGALKDLENLAQSRSVELKFESKDKASHAVPKVLGDKDRVQQIIYNLIGNAIKFTEKGAVSVNCEVDDEKVRVTVTDTGEGIPEDRQKLLFRKFQQAGGSIWTRETSNGTGLGLYISKLLIEGMGGSIWLDHSAKGKGSAFAFTLLLDNDHNHDQIRKKQEPVADVNTETGLTHDQGSKPTVLE